MHEGDVVTVEGEIMHEPKASALSARDCYYITLVHSLNPVMHTQLVFKYYLMLPIENASMVKIAQHFKYKDSEWEYKQECLDTNFNWISMILWQLGSM